MKNRLFTIFRICIFLVLFAKVLNWILHFSDETNSFLNMAMFFLIGIAYLVMGYLWDTIFTRIIITTCGLFLIAMNFVESSMFLNILRIFCILTPMLIARFSKEAQTEPALQKTQ